MFEDAQQLILHIERHLFNLVEKECSHLVGTENTAAGSDGLGQISAFVAEQLPGELFTAEICAIDG
jgi:hypothetical protein